MTLTTVPHHGVPARSPRCGIDSTRNALQHLGDQLVEHGHQLGTAEARILLLLVRELGALRNTKVSLTTRLYGERVGLACREAVLRALRRLAQLGLVILRRGPFMRWVVALPPAPRALTTENAATGENWMHVSGVVSRMCDSVLAQLPRAGGGMSSPERAAAGQAIWPALAIAVRMLCYQTTSLDLSATCLHVLQPGKSNRRPALRWLDSNTSVSYTAGRGRGQRGQVTLPMDQTIADPSELAIDDVQQETPAQAMMTEMGEWLDGRIKENYAGNKTLATSSHDRSVDFLAKKCRPLVLAGWETLHLKLWLSKDRKDRMWPGDPGATEPMRSPVSFVAKVLQERAWADAEANRLPAVHRLTVDQVQQLNHERPTRPGGAVQLEPSTIGQSSKLLELGNFQTLHEQIQDLKRHFTPQDHEEMAEASG